MQNFPRNVVASRSVVLINDKNCMYSWFTILPYSLILYTYADLQINYIPCLYNTIIILE